MPNSTTTEDNSSQNAAIIMAGSASLLVAFTVIVTRDVVDRVDPLLLGFLRYGPAGLLFLPLLAKRWRTIKKPDWLPIIGLGVLFYGLYPWLFSLALEYTVALHAALVIPLLPMATLVIAWLLGKEHITGPKMTGLCCALCGVLFAFSEGFRADSTLPETALLGDFIMLIAMLLSAVFNVFSAPYIRRYSALSVTAICMTSGAVALFALTFSAGFLNKLPDLSSTDWGLVAFLSLGGAILANFLWLSALGKTTPSRVAVFAMLSPLVVAVFGSILLGENPSVTAIVGLILVIAGIAISQFGRA